MAITVYTYNDKVLKNVATDKWLKKADAPAGFVMDASNVVNISGTYAYWESPGYAVDYYDGNGKTIIITLTEDLDATQVNLMYAQTSNDNSTNPSIISQFPLTAGTYTFTMTANPVPDIPGYTMGKYIMIYINNIDHIAQELSKITITIPDL